MDLIRLNHRPLTPADARTLEDWAEEDPAGWAWISGTDIDRSCAQADVQTLYGSMRERLLIHHGEPVGYLSLDAVEEVCWVALYIREESRRRGLGIAALTIAAVEAAEMGTWAVRGCVGLTNLASTDLVISLGWKAVGINEDGLLEWEHPAGYPA